MVRPIALWRSPFVEYWRRLELPIDDSALILHANDNEGHHHNRIRTQGELTAFVYSLFGMQDRIKATASACSGNSLWRPGKRGREMPRPACAIAGEAVLGRRHDC